MSSRLRNGVILLAGLCIFQSSRLEAAPLSPAERDSIELQQRQLLQQNQQQRQELERSLTPTQTSPATPAPTSTTCFPLDTITLTGADHMPARVQQRLIQPYVHQCDGIAQINALVKQVSDWYIAEGYITSRAFLTEQDLSQGTLTLRVMEGKLEAIHMDNQPRRTLTMAFPGLTGNILNLRDIEQGMEQINRLRAIPVQVEIQPGSQPGYSIVNLTAKPQFPLNASLGFDNSGQKRTGVGQVNGSLTGNNLLGLADQWFVSGARSSDFASDHDAQSVQAGVSVPYGYWNLDYSYSYSNYLSTLQSQGYDWRSSGDSQSHRMTLSRVLFRNGQMKTAASLGVNHRLDRNYLNDVALQSSSRSLSSWTAGINHSQKIAGGYATLNPAFSRGVPWLGGEDDAGKSADTPRAEFSKWTLSGSYYLPLIQRVTWLSSLYGQWSDDRLYGSERLTLGGESSVRGFKEQYLSGDRGGYWRNELDTQVGSLPGLGQISSVAALDGGYLQHDNDDSNAAGTLWGAAIGLASSNGHIASQFTVGWPLSYPATLTPDRVTVYYRLAITL
ncbi:MAG: ShlB/FhaC/HecB family hemolysin secretion/activation protein [Rouxiella aceris]|uniref:ShlB/FhaC/HecB family hemolysin secretion/activation protein n=1 Tax=Rouxiella aceris TaxID=2703884 RepID=UPI001F405B70|nr:ShlB/FhaC/HecB family hemolysin secretion/activation protein [Rouxiella aceris]MDR3434506.1 ShlB/FhaC/HecB family hemolysin secretion/activation protein [Rouxiella aceris]